MEITVVLDKRIVIRRDEDIDLFKNLDLPTKDEEKYKKLAIKLTLECIKLLQLYLASAARIRCLDGIGWANRYLRSKIEVLRLWTVMFLKKEAGESKNFIIDSLKRSERKRTEEVEELERLYQRV